MNDYPWLASTVAEYLNRADVYATLPTFISLAEAQIGRRLGDAGVQGFYTRATIAVATEFVAEPTGLSVLAQASIFDPNQQLWLPLEISTSFGIQVLRGERETTRGIPDRIAVFGTQLQFSPVPDASYQVQIDYIAPLAPLTAANPTNWVIASYPDVYLYGVLSQTTGYYPDLAADTRAARWRGAFDLAVTETIVGERAKRGPQRTPGFRASDTPPNYGRRSWSFNFNSGL